MKNTLFTRYSCLVTSFALCACATTSNAAVVAGQSNAHGVDVGLSAVSGLATLTVGPLPSTSGVAPVQYSLNNQVLSVTASTLGVANLGTGVITVNASSNVDGGAGTRNAAANATVDDLNLQVVPGIILVPDFIHLTAGTIFSSSMVSSDGSSFTTNGGFFIEDAVLNIAGVGNVIINANAAPNTVVFNALGITIIANEQYFSGDGITTRGLTTNALHITVAPLGGNLVQGDVVIAHSYSELTIPAPGSAGLIGALSLAAIRRRR